MTGNTLEQRARELLAAEYEAAGATPLHVTEVRSGEHDTFADRVALRAIDASLAQSAQQSAPALEVFRVAGGDTECCPNPTAEQAMACLRDLRACYDETQSAQQAGAVPEGFVALVSEIAGQKPEKPDHWNSCSQCERNIEAAQDLLTHAPPAPSGGWRSMDSAPTEACRYLVSDGEEVREARWQPRLGKWKFPSAQAGLRTVTDWQPLPPAPVKQEGVDRG